MRPILMSAGLLVLGACSSEAVNSDDSLLREDTTPTTTVSTASGAANSGAAGMGSSSGSTATAPTTTTTPSTTSPQTSPQTMVVPTAGAAAPTDVMATTPGDSVGMTGAAGDAAMDSAMAAAAGAPAEGAAGADAAPAEASGPAMGTLTLAFTTKTYGGFYAPRNYGAVWFETPGGDFIKTAKRWAGQRHASDLSTWTTASGGWGGGFGGGGNTADMADAVSLATLRDHEMHTVMWNANDVEKMLVEDGDYVACVELTEDRVQTPGPVLRIPFTKGHEAQTVEPSDEASFTGVKLTWEPN